MNNIYKDQKFVEKIKKRISDKKFDNKDALIAYLRHFDNLNNDEELKKFKLSMLEHYDKVYKNEQLKPDGLQELKVDDDKYIKYKDTNGKTIVLENNVSNKSLIDQYNNIQNDLVATEKTDKLKDSDEIKNEMQRKKIEVSLEKEVNENELSNKEKEQLNAIKATNDFKKDNYIFDTERNIYINENTNETYKVDKNKEGHYEVKTAENNMEKEVVEITNEEIMTKIASEQPIMGNSNNDVQETKEEVQVENKMDLNGMTNVDLEFLASSNRLTDEQLVQVNQEIMKREKTEKFVDTYEKPKVFQKKFNGYSSLLILSLVTGIGGMSLFLYILLMIG